MGKRLREPVTKISKLPKAIREKVKMMLIGPVEERKYYTQISSWLALKGYTISKTTIARYAASLLGNSTGNSRKARSIKSRIKKKVNDGSLPKNEAKFYSLINDLVELYEAELKPETALKEEDTKK